jgi:glycosyltransferase involved in cell wall biosynthesis
MGQPLISVVIPAYNHQRFVGKAVESVLNQTCSDFELIIVNDGSTDKTEDVIKGFEDRRIRYYYQENQDAFNTINRGISLAKGRYISILNSDDMYTLDRLEKLVGVCEEVGAVCAFSDVIPIDENGKEFTDPDLWWNVWYKTNRQHYFSCGDIAAAFLRGNLMVTTSNLFMAADASRQIGPFSALRYLHDYDFILRIIQKYTFNVNYLDNERLVFYRIHGGNTLSEAAITGREQDKELIRKYMLEAIPEPYKKYAAVGSDRLVELEQELHQVRQQLHPSQQEGVRPALRELKRSVKSWVHKKLS